jgi:hypothetical protein
MATFRPVLRSLLRSNVAAPRFIAAKPRAFAISARRFAAAPSFTNREQPRLRLGSDAPNFTAVTTHGELNFHESVPPPSLLYHPR